MSMGGILFIGLGGVLADIGWRYPFLIYFASFLVLPLANLFLREPAFTQKNAQENRNIKSPPIIWLLFINTMFMWILFFLIPVHVPFLLQSMGFEKNAVTGAVIATSTAFSALSSFSYSRIKDRFSFLSVFSMGYFLMAAGFICLSIANTYLLVIIAMMLSGLGMGMMIPNTNMWVMKMTPPQIRGKEIGKLTTFWFLGQFLSPIIALPVVNILSLSSTFRLASGVLFLLSIGLFIFDEKQNNTVSTSDVFKASI